VESSIQAAEGSAARESGPERLTQIGLLIASLGALLVIFNLFGLGIVGLFLAGGGAVLAAPGGLGKGWFVAVALGAIVAILSRLIAEGSEVAGGWLAVAGSIAILTGTILGFPTREEQRK
jgi:hypothetical protein